MWISNIFMAVYIRAIGEYTRQGCGLNWSKMMNKIRKLILTDGMRIIMTLMAVYCCKVGQAVAQPAPPGGTNAEIDCYCPKKDQRACIPMGTKCGVEMGQELKSVTYCRLVQSAGNKRCVETKQTVNCDVFRPKGESCAGIAVLRTIGVSCKLKTNGCEIIRQEVLLPCTNPSQFSGQDGHVYNQDLDGCGQCKSIEDCILAKRQYDKLDSNNLCAPKQGRGSERHQEQCRHQTLSPNANDF